MTCEHGIPNPDLCVLCERGNDPGPPLLNTLPEHEVWALIEAEKYVKAHNRRCGVGDPTREIPFDKKQRRYMQVPSGEAS